MATIHLADRDETYRSRLARALRQTGADVTEFASGSELYAQTLEAPPDLVVMETDLDEADGFQVFQWLHGRRNTTPPLVVFLTTFEHPGIARVCKERGARDFIGKGRTLEAVVERVLAVLGERDPLNGRRLGAALAWLQSRGKSGRLEAQACGRPGTILLHNGRVISVRWDVWEGDDALRLLTEVHSASTFRFVEGIEEMAEVVIEETAAPLQDDGIDGRSQPLPSYAGLPVLSHAIEAGDEPLPIAPLAALRSASLPGRPGGVVPHPEEESEPTPTPVLSQPGQEHGDLIELGRRSEGLQILIPRGSHRRRQRRMTLPLIAASVAVVLTGGLTVAALFERQQAERTERSDAGAATPVEDMPMRVPPPLSIAGAAAGAGLRHADRIPAGEPARPDDAAVSVRARPAREAQPVTADETSPRAPSVTASPQPRPSTPAPSRLAETGRAESMQRRERAATPSVEERGERPEAALAYVRARPVAALAPSAVTAAGPQMPVPELIVVPAPPPETDPVEVARQEVERRTELEQLERRASATRLDAVPAPKEAVRFRYPRELADQRVKGSMELLVHLDPTGAVDDVRVLRSSGSRELDRVAAAAVRRSSYQPPRRDGHPVSAWIRQPLVGMCCREEGSR